MAGIQGDAISNINKLVDLSGGMFTTGNRIGFYVGPYVSIPVSEKISVEPAVYYAQKGYELKGGLAMKAINFLGVNAHASLNANYIDLPVVIKANFNGFQVFAGPQVSYLTKAELKSTAGILGINLLKNTLDATAQFNRWDAGVTGGVGYQFANGMNITAAYNRGLTKLDANKSMNSYSHSFKLGLGVRF